MPKWSRRQIEAYYYSLYLLLLEEARMSFTKIGNYLGINNKSAAKLYRMALKEEVLFPPYLRLKSFPNFQEYIYFLKFRNAFSLFEKLKNDQRVIYESVCSGAFDLMVIANERIDFSMEHGFEYFILSGPRSDFIYNKVEKKSMDQYFAEFQDFLKNEDFIKSEIKSPTREKLLWDDLDLALFKLLKHDLRMRYIKILRCLDLSKSVFYDHLHNVTEKCAVWTPYFPKNYPNYDEYFVLFKTSHENQLVDELKKTPVHCPIFKVKGWVYAYIMVEREFSQRVLFDTLNLMLSSGFVEEYRYSVPIYQWGRTWTTQDFRHHHSPRSHHKG